MIFSIDALEKISSQIAPVLVPGRPLLLSGPLGVGKTTLARALIRKFCPHENVIPSPSFPLMLPYYGEETLWHVDLYRLTHEDEILPLGLLEAMIENRCIIEWPERLGRHRPGLAIRCEIRFTAKETERQLFFQGEGPLPSFKDWV